MTGKDPLRILALLEAASISGTAKAVLEMAYEARVDISDERQIRIFVAIFARGEGAVDNVLTRALEQAQIPFSLIREKGRFDNSVLPKIRNLLDEYGAQVVWTNSVKSHFLVNRAGVEKKAKWVAFHHGYTSTDLKMKLYNELDRLSLRNASRVLTVCEPFANQLAARGVNRKLLRVQHMPIRSFLSPAHDAAELRNELGLDREAKVVLSVGRLSQEKGHVDLLRAFTLLRKQIKGDFLRLVLVGDGPERARLEKLARADDQRASVIFTGHRDDAIRFYGMADVFALPSYSEGTPNVLLEAMSSRLPVVATAVGGIPELATDGLNALLTPANDPPALAGALRRILESTALRNELVDAAENVVAAHSPRNYFTRMREIFLEVAAE